MSIIDKIQSLQSQLKISYRRPPVDKLEKMISNLKSNLNALDYLRIQRGLLDETIDHFKLGYDMDKNAIAIPIFKRGELVNIKYRLLDPKDRPKYTQEKDCEVWLYNEEGIQDGIKKGGVLIVEGEIDLMSCWQAGIKNVVSPASGKDSYGIWLELMDNLPQIFIAYDNDKAGKDTALKLSERIGVEKCKEILYPEGIKDANDYFRKFKVEDYKELIKNARPFYRHQFKGLVDIIEELRSNKNEAIQLQFLPDVKLGKDWLVVISGLSNVGKTAFTLNLAKELTDKDLPTLILPFERGTQVVGSRFLQVKYKLGEGDLVTTEAEEWDKISKESINLPLYFAMPQREETMELIKKAKRIFDIKIVIIDHLDYMVRSSTSKEQEIGQTLQALKRLAEEFGIIMLIVTHVRKISAPGSTAKSKPNIEDLKGSASLYQDPECVVMLTSPEAGQIEVSVVKNKGKMSNQVYGFNSDTGALGGLVDKSKADKEFDDF